MSSRVRFQSCGVRGGVARKRATTAPSSRAPTTARRAKDHGGHPYKHGPWDLASPAAGAGDGRAVGTPRADLGSGAGHGDDVPNPGRSFPSNRTETFPLFSWDFRGGARGGLDAPVLVLRPTRRGWGGVRRIAHRRNLPARGDLRSADRARCSCSRQLAASRWRPSTGDRCPASTATTSWHSSAALISSPPLPRAHSSSSAGWELSTGSRTLGSRPANWFTMYQTALGRWPSRSTNRVMNPWRNAPAGVTGSRRSSLDRCACWPSARRDTHRPAVAGRWQTQRRPLRAGLVPPPHHRRPAPRNRGCDRSDPS